MDRLFILTIGLCLLLTNCDVNSADEKGNEALPTDVSYSSDIQPIFNGSCAGSACHIGESTNGVRLDSYEDTKNSMGLTYEKLVIQPGKPEESPLVDKIEPKPDIGERMPLTKEPLSEDEIKMVKGWINEGAKDN